MTSITQIPKGIARDLGLPGRDILRGVRSTLAPAKALLPAPVRLVLRKFDASLTPSGLPDSLTPDADFFSGKHEHTAQFAMVAHAALTEVLQLMQRDHLMVSETVLALGLRRAALPSRKHNCASQVAADVAKSIIKHHAVGCVPGTPYGMQQEDLDDTSVAVFTVLLWLLVDRPEPGQREAALLKLCHDVAVTQRADILAAFGAYDTLAALLDANARLI
ncbi:hypothetical protein [Roseinatronobacter sp. NSM]|uniref:hypothetical protein n=1 Tax=Roseinatronobacter sp. NSM TaxID=3457785 RepID=UPI0040351790